MTDDPRDPSASIASDLDGPGLDTPGPYATAEQDASVTSLLGLLRPDDLPMPDDVVRRLDAVLAEERRLARTGAATGLAGAAALDGGVTDTDTDDGSGASGAGLATVLPMSATAGRRARDLGWLTWLGGAAAAVLVVGSGFVLLGHGGSSSVSTAAGTVAPETATDSGAAAGTTAVRATNTDYSAKALPTQVGALLSTVPAKDAVATAGNADNPPAATPAAESSPAEAVAPSPSSATRAASSASAGSGFAAAQQQALTSATVAACMMHLGLPGVIPLVVDHGRFEGKPADVVVVATEGDPATVDVYVLHPGCATAEPLVYEFATVARG